MTTDDWRKFWDLTKDIKIGMFSAFSSDGLLHSRPMATQNRPDDRHNKLWFFMSRSGAPVLDLVRDPNVNVAYADPKAAAYISVAGHAAVFDDVQTKKDLWSAVAQAWFPGGPEDPEVALVAVTIDHAELWKVEDNQMIHMVNHGEVRTDPTEA
jgi:general stress protein 26